MTLRSYWDWADWNKPMDSSRLIQKVKNYIKWRLEDASSVSWIPEEELRSNDCL